MPPRFAYWTIIAGGLPTAFRAADREELLPTFTRVKAKQPDAEMKWFSRGRLWESPEEARTSRDRGRADVRGRSGSDLRDRPTGPRSQERPREKPASGRTQDTRGRDWRPGGNHRDPRQPFKDARKARNQRAKAEKFARKFGSERAAAPRERPHGDPLAPNRRTRHDGSRQGEAREPRGSRPDSRRDRRDQEPRKPWQHDRRENEPRSTRAGNHMPRGTWKNKPPRGKPHGDKVMRPPRETSGHERPRNKDRAGTGRDGGDAFREGRSTYRGGSRGDNAWKGAPPPDANRPSRRPFAAGGFARDRVRAQGTEEPPSPPRPRGPNREPRPSEQPTPAEPPRPTEPVVPPPGPPERGRLNRSKRKR